MTFEPLNTTPFHSPSGKPVVSVAGGDGPYENTLKALASIDLSPASGKRVLLKPNAGRIASVGGGGDNPSAGGSCCN